MDVPWQVELGGKPEHFNTECWEIKHAKIQGNMKLCQGEIPEGGCSTANDATLVGPCFARGLSERVFEAGESYLLRRREFHTSKVGGLAITVVHRSNFDVGLARVLGDESVKVGSAICRDTKQEEINFFVRQAREAMIRAA